MPKRQKCKIFYARNRNACIIQVQMPYGNNGHLQQY